MNVELENNSPARGDLRVLLVEDSETDAQLLVRQLQRFGYTPTWKRVDHPDTLRSALEAEPWDLVLADYSMPQFSGLDALELVNASGRRIPFILVSGTIGEETAVAAMRAGASDYLLKDRLTRLGVAVQRSLEEADTRRARRLAEDRLRLLFHAVEQSPAMIVVTDTAGNMEYVNPRFTAVTGYSSESVRGAHCRILKSDRTPAADYARLWQTIAAGGEWRGEFVNRKRNGELFWEAAAISPVRDSAGQIRHYVKISEDITEQKRTAETMRKLEAQLRRVQKTEVLSELAGGIAHEFNNFLGAVIMNAQVARSHADGEQAEYLDRAIAASRQAAGLARQILTLSRRDEQDRRPIPLGSAVLHALKLLHATLPAGVEVEVDVPTGGRTVLADAGQIQQIVVNLWTNACHALPPTGGRIAVSLADVDVDAELAAQHAGLHAGPYVRLTVRDNGCGIGAEILEQVFEPFFTTKPEGQGTGLGLSVVQSIMTGHQGAIVVESQPQVGTAMHLFFPEHSQPAVSAATADTPPPRGGGERILLVDDHALVRNATCTMLEKLGYRVAAYGQPLEALAAFLARPDEFDLVLTDLSMQEMNGAELAREMLAARPGMPIVAVSGYELAGLARQLRDLGIGELLTKPVERESLAAALARALARAPATPSGA